MAISRREISQSASKDLTIAIIGGGPGGLFTAWYLAAKLGPSWRATIYEASDRIGGLIRTARVPGIGLYEAGAAEIYDYSGTGPDPLRELIEDDLGLSVRPIAGGACVMDGEIIPNREMLALHFGERTRDEVNAFRRHCAAMMTKRDYFRCARHFENSHPWAQISAEDLLNEKVSDPAARRYIRTMAHTDVAAPPHLTNGLTLLKNAVMDLDGYMNIISVKDGNEQIVEKLVGRLKPDIRRGCPVRAVRPLDAGGFELDVGVNGVRRCERADYVIACLPLTALATIDWQSDALQRAIARHIRYFDRPGHYLRATLFFRRPFWRDKIPGSWWMMDAFEGCCVYDESARHDHGPWGALGFLIAGNAALNLSNLPDARIEELCLNALPPALAEARDLIVDRRIHRCLATVNAIPGGYPLRSPQENHRPAGDAVPGFVVVGDYMFDSTLNGVLDSADAATDIVLADILRRQRDHAPIRVNAECAVAPVVGGDRVRGRFFEAPLLGDLFDCAWGLGSGARVLHLGSGKGATVMALRALGFDAVGLEPDREAWSETPAEARRWNIYGGLAPLEYDDGEFDFVFETVLNRLALSEARKAISEIRRVTAHGLLLGSITLDLPLETFERHGLLEESQTLLSRWGWSDMLFGMGFDFALADPAQFTAAWKLCLHAGAAHGRWYDLPESLLYSLYDVTGRSGASDLATAAEGERVGRKRDHEDYRLPMRRNDPTEQQFSD